MQAPKYNETAMGDRAVDAMNRLRAFVLANESDPANSPGCAPERTWLESSMATPSEAVSSGPAERPARPCESNNAVGVHLHGLPTVRIYGIMWRYQQARVVIVPVCVETICSWSVVCSMSKHGARVGRRDARS